MSNKFVFDCSICDTKCDGISLGKYIFENDAAYSERKENIIINQINSIADYKAEKCTLDGYPDILVKHIPTNSIFYIEIKAQRRTFMSVRKKLPNSDLCPSETIACNLSDLLRYIDIAQKDKCKIFVLWCLENRPCIVRPGSTKYYYQSIDELAKIYNKYTDARRFRRKSGDGDYVDGQHKGVVVNYHFSLNEFLDVHLSELLKKGIS